MMKTAAFRCCMPHFKNAIRNKLDIWVIMQKMSILNTNAQHTNF